MKTILLLACLVYVALLAAGCTPAKQEETEPSTQAPSRPLPAPAPAPGTAKASALVQGYETQDNHYVCTLKIEEVAAYGAGTPALPVGTEIDVVVSKALFKDDPDGSKAAAMLATGHAVSITLKHLTAATAGEAPPAPSWRAISIE